jgi:hypothetical protein
MMCDGPEHYQRSYYNYRTANAIDRDRFRANEKWFEHVYLDARANAPPGRKTLKSRRVTDPLHAGSR